MALNLSNLKPASGSKQRKVRIGRGNASAHGTYSGRGAKGQRARSGGRSGLKARGMKARLQKIPKLRGFHSQYAKPEIVSLATLEKSFASGAEITLAVLKKKEIVKNITKQVKLIGNNKLTKKFSVKGCAVSAGAKTQIEAAGGSVL